MYMPKFGRKNTFESIIFSKLTLVVLLVISLFTAHSVYERWQVERDMAARRESIELQYQDLENRKAALEEKVDYLQGETGVESEIRRNFDVAREGEQVVIIVDEEEGQTVSLQPGLAPEVDDGKPWYQFW